MRAFFSVSQLSDSLSERQLLWNTVGEDGAHVAPCLTQKVRPDSHYEKAEEMLKYRELNR